jgi:hypothetical protein
VKPLFIPLKTKYFRAFQNGTKVIEFRPYGPRWNERTCPVGRPVVLSHGYGKRERLQGVVSVFTVDNNPVAQIAEWREVYGDSTSSVAACIAITLNRSQS